MPGPLTRAPQESTIGAAFLTQTVSVNDATVKFEIWCVAPVSPFHSLRGLRRDTAGQERYHSLAPMYYRGDAARLVDRVRTL